MVPELLGYKLVKDELAVSDGILIRGARIVVPSCLREQVLKLGHEGHPGISVMKSRMRTKVWWPKIDKDVEKGIKTCKSCLQVSIPHPPEPMKRRQIPDRPWKDLAVDFLGPLPSGHYILVVVDYFSRYFEIKILTSITTKQTITELKEIFARFGIPFSLTADNGPQFRIINYEFRKFCEQFGITLYNTIPEWPQQNGLVERQNRGLLKRLKISQIEGSDWRADLLEYLLMYRSTPLIELGKSPSELLFGWNIKDKIPQLSRPNFTPSFEEVTEKDGFQKEKGRIYADNKRGAKVSVIIPGDTVIIREKRLNKLSPNFGGEEFLVIKKNSSELEIKSKRNGRVLKRNSAHVLKIGDQSGNVSLQELDDGNAIDCFSRGENVTTPNDTLFNGFEGFDDNTESVFNGRDESPEIMDRSSSFEHNLLPDPLPENSEVSPEFSESSGSVQSVPEPRPKRARVTPKRLNDYIVGYNELLQ